MSVVDRSIVPILPGDPDDTPSRRQGVLASVERTHRLYGASLLAAATELLKLNASTYATSCTIFHRFYHQASLTKYSVWSVAMASLLLATKVEDGPQQRTIRNIVLIFDHLYRKRKNFKQNDNDANNNDDNRPKKVPAMPKLGPAWKEYNETILEMENHILRALGFTLYWIPDNHPHKFLWEFLRLLFGLESTPITIEEEVKEEAEVEGGTADEKISINGNGNDNEQDQSSEKKKEANDDKKEKQHYELGQRAWNYCNDSCRMDLCARFDSEVITCAAIFLAASDFKLSLPTKPQPWWELFLGNDDDEKDGGGVKIATVSNALLGLGDYERKNPTILKEFLPSLIPGGSSFNDPGSFLWENRVEF